MGGMLKWPIRPSSAYIDERVPSHATGRGGGPRSGTYRPPGSETAWAPLSSRASVLRSSSSNASASTD